MKYIDELYAQGKLRCQKCQEIKPLSDFVNDKRRKYGKKYWCKRCDAAQYWRKKASKSVKEFKVELEASNLTYEEFIHAKGGKCEICGNHENLCLDHCHKTAVFRGLLCKRCNTGIAYFKDSPELLITAAEYLVKHKIC